MSIMKDLTVAEVNWLVRRRAKVRQQRWAIDHGKSVFQLREEEKGRREPTDQEANNLGELTDGEWCALQRRRHGWTMAEVSKRAGISRMTVWKAEHDRTAGVAALRRFYVQQGVLHAIHRLPEPAATGPGKL